MDQLWAHVALAVIALLAATILPGSSEAFLAALLIQRPQDSVSLFLTATAGNTAGAALNWAFGRWLAKFAGRPWFPASPAWIERASKWFGSYGMWLLLLSWVPIIGDPLTVAAGMLRTRFIPFVVIVAVGKAARYAAVVGGVQVARPWF